MPTKKKTSKKMSRTTSKKATKKLVKKATKVAPAKRKRFGPYPYVLKKTYAQVTVGGEPFSLDSTHATFAQLAEALRNHQWSKVPGLINLAKRLQKASRGNVNVINGQVYYKGVVIEQELTKRIIAMVKGGRKVDYMLKFLDNLFQNESPEARAEFGNWLLDNDLPITDDGCFLAYKSVDSNLKDEHTHTIDNSPGKVIMMSRRKADLDYRTQCAVGFHICSKQYGYYGTRILAVKANPRDVIAANSGKMRVWKYEVIMELGRRKDVEEFKLDGYSQLEKKLVYEIKAERREVLAILLKSKPVQRMIRQGKIRKATIQKGTYGYLTNIARRFDLLPVQAFPEKEEQLPLQAARKAAGLTIGQMARQLKKDYTTVSRMERNQHLNQAQTDDFLEAIAKLKGQPAVSFKRELVAA